jgi:hypothetical protein
MKYSLNGKKFDTETSVAIIEIVFSDGTDVQEAVDIMKTAKGTIWYYRTSEHKVTVLTLTELYDLVINFNGYENLGTEEVADLEEIEGLQGLANYMASFEDA